MNPVHIAWNRFATIPRAAPFDQALSKSELAPTVAGAKASVHPAFEISPGVILEIPPPQWGHGDFLVYLQDRNWMVRRNYVDHWYVDIGFVKAFEQDVWGWTDLWLDIIAPASSDGYRLLDAGEFGEALRAGTISVGNAALAMESLDALIKAIENGDFPPPEVCHAEALYESSRRGGILSA